MRSQAQLFTRTAVARPPAPGLRRLARYAALALAGVFGLLVVAGSALGVQIALLQWWPASTAAPTSGSAARLTTVAEFPVGTFLENLTVRADGSMLVTDLAKNQLWYLPAPGAEGTVQPLLLHTFDAPPFDIVEPQPNLFYVDTSEYLTSRQSYLERVDLRGWAPGMPVPVQTVLKFPFAVSSANGSCALSSNVLLVADALLGLIWRVDLSADGTRASARVWLQHASMLPNPFTFAVQHKVQPGINGVEYSEKTHFLYYTATAQTLFMRVRVDPRTLEPAGDPERVAIGHQWDDFEIDDNAGVAYITTHRENTIERVPLDPGSGQSEQTVAGKAFDPQLVGPSDFAWGPRDGDLGSIAYVSSDGGNTAPPPDGIVRTAKVLRVQL